MLIYRNPTLISRRRKEEKMEETETYSVMLTVKEVQEILKIGRNKVYEVFARQDFPAICLGRRYVVEQKAFNTWLQSRREPEK